MIGLWLFSDNNRTMEYSLYSGQEALEVGARELLDLMPNCVGLDTETSINGSQPVDLIQIATSSKVYLFQIGIVIPSRLATVLASRDIVKVGVDITTDNARLSRMGVEMKGVIDIQDLAQTMALPAKSLDQLATLYLNKTVPKKRILGNYSGELSEEKINYAAQDAVMSLLIYQAIIQGVKPTVLELKPIEDQEVFNWITNELRCATNNRKYTSMANMIVNGFGEWRKRFIEHDRKKIACEVLDKYIEKGLWSFDQKGKVFICIG